ncbi:MAG: sigma factor-like helix-turn-helix DNA-binding protein [Actinomycetota bacterium]|nr:sigma factor-like helix-turn-helix DNA-binding protein [Actinomycetota bacterium]
MTDETKLADAYRAAHCYYLQEMTMEEIGRDLGASRSTVSRLLSLARAEGLVEFRLRAPTGEVPSLEREVAARFRVDAHVVPTGDRTSEREALEQVARFAGMLLGTICDSGMVLGVAWGTTIEAVSRHLSRKPTRGSEIVQLNGAGNTYSTGIEYASEILVRFGRAFEARVQQFPVPTFFDYAATREALWRERSIIRVLELQERADVMCFSVGAVHGGVPSHVYSGGFLEDRDYALLDALGVVGDVATVFLRESGTSDNIPLNDRSSGPPHSVIRRAPRRVCVVSGVNKARGLRAALAGRLVTDLVIDERSAEALVALPAL